MMMDPSYQQHVMAGIPTTIAAVPQNETNEEKKGEQMGGVGLLTLSSYPEFIL